MTERIERLVKEPWYFCVVCQTIHLECEAAYEAHTLNRRTFGAHTMYHEHLEEVQS